MAAAYKAFLKKLDSDAEAREVVPKKPPYAAIISGLALIILLFSAGAFIISTHNKTPSTPQEIVELTSLNVESVPIGAQIFIDGSFKGKTPLKLDIPLGKHEVRLSLPEYYEWEEQLQLEEKGEIPLSIRLVPSGKQGE